MLAFYFVCGILVLVERHKQWRNKMETNTQTLEQKIETLVYTLRTEANESLETIELIGAIYGTDSIEYKELKEQHDKNAQTLKVLGVLHIWGDEKVETLKSRLVGFAR